MLQGTTPTHRFKLPFDTERVAEARVIYKQRGETVLTKTMEDFDMDGQWLSLKLSQEETFLFRLENVTYQLRVKDVSGTALATKPKTISVTECLEEEVI